MTPSRTDSDSVTVLNCSCHLNSFDRMFDHNIINNSTNKLSKDLRRPRNMTLVKMSQNNSGSTPRKKCDKYDIIYPSESDVRLFMRNLKSIIYYHKLFVYILFIVCLLLPTSSTHSPSTFGSSKFPSIYDNWDYGTSLSSDGAFIVEWTPMDDKIFFKLTVRTTGYIGFGLATSGRMDGADIVVGWVHTGKAYLQDRHGKGNREPLVDDQQDWMLVWGSENNTHTVLIMSRPYNTCDPRDHVISNDTVSLLWAYHPDDPVDPESPRPRLHYHGGTHRGSVSIVLLQSPPQLDLDFDRRSPVHSWDMTNEGVEVEATTDTLYWCKIFKRPPLMQKNHILKYEPIFTDGNDQYVHHMIVYECKIETKLELAFEELAMMEGHHCHQANMSTLLYTCNTVVVAWAIGSKGLSLPPEAGYPLEPNGPKFYMLETHYDNPESPGIPGMAFTDYSGVRIFHTPDLRNFDAGVMSVGMDPGWKHLIPPRQRTVISQGHCVGECTEAALPATGVHVFATILHTHLLGRRVKIRHLRNGEELEPIAMDNNYDFNYQEYRSLHKPRLVLPGDHLISECVYNSRERSTITLGGFKTRDEMCLSFIFYWPKVDISFCHSRLSLSTVLQSLGIEELSRGSNLIKIRRPIELAGKTLEWRLQNYDWENHFESYQETIRTGSFNAMCWRSGETIIKGLLDRNYENPNITDAWEPENECRRIRRKNRRRKNKNREHTGTFHRQYHQRTHHQHSMEGSHLLEDHFQDELMADDETNSKPIERIDVDPITNFDVILPVIEDTPDFSEPIKPYIHEEQNNYGISMSEDYGIPDPNINEEEFQEMERDLAKELNINRYPENLQGQTAQHNPVEESSLSCASRLTRRTSILLSLGLLLSLHLGRHSV